MIIMRHAPISIVRFHDPLVVFCSVVALLFSLSNYHHPSSGLYPPQHHHRIMSYDYLGLAFHVLVLTYFLSYLWGGYSSKGPRWLPRIIGDSYLEVRGIYLYSDNARSLALWLLLISALTGLVVPFLCPY